MLTHLYLSPHFDDAVLSCGGLIAQQTSAGDRVVVATICAAGPAAGTALSPFAQMLEARWLEEFPGQDPIPLRRQEDEAACHLLGAEVIFLEERDCIYRRAPDGVWMYDSEEALNFPPHPGDDPAPLTASLLALIERVQPDILYAPLAAGAHVDHRRVRSIAAGWVHERRPLFFYEDYPYVERIERLWWALNQPAPGVWLRRPCPLTVAEAEAKVAAVACYASQFTSLFDGDMRARVRAQLQRAGAPGMAEVLWQCRG